MKASLVKTLPLLALLPFLAACNKPVIYANDRPMQELKHTFKTPSKETYEAAKKALLDLGYKVDMENEETASLKSGMVPTKVDSHYTALFDRKDYSTTGAYYRVEIRVRPKKVSESEVTIQTVARTLVPNMKTSYRVETEILERMATLLRAPNVKISNVGIEE